MTVQSVEDYLTSFEERKKNKVSLKMSLASLDNDWKTVVKNIGGNVLL